MSTPFLNRNKTNILLAGLCILFAWLIINWFRYLMNNYFILKGTNSTSTNTSIIRSAMYKEGFEQNIYDVKTYDNQYTHSIDLPINTDKSCSNFCDPVTKQVIGVNKPTWRIYDYNFNLVLFEERINIVHFIGGNVGLMYAT